MNTQRLAGLQHQARQPRLAAKAEVKPETKISDRMKGATADDDNYGDVSLAWFDEPMSLTSLGNIVEPIAPERRVGDALINGGTEVLKPHLSPVEVQMLASATDGLLLAGKVST